MENRQKRLTEDQRQEVIQRYEDGHSAPRLAQQFGVSRQAIHKLLVKRQVPIRRRPLTKDQGREIAERFRAGAAPITLARQFDVKTETIIDWLQRARVP